MERSENVTATMTRIKKSVDRSNTILLRSIGYFESPHSFVEAAPMAPQLVAGIRVGPKAGPVSAAVVQ
ncbi:MAG: hypothetical protein WA813_13760 [Beijerinckiaceae bacterium]